MSLPSLRNLLLASLSGKVTYAVSSLVMLPLFAGLFGTEAVGLLGFFTTLLMVLMVLEGGLTSGVTRALASESHSSTATESSGQGVTLKIINTYLLTFVALGTFVASFVAISADLIASNWLNVESLSISDVRESIRWMGVFVGLNFPIAILQGALTGRELQIGLNILYAPYALARTLGVLAAFYFIGEPYQTAHFFMAQAIIQSIYLLALIALSYFDLPKNPLRVAPDWRILRDGFWFGRGVFFISMTSAVVMQFDKLYLSGKVSLGTYAAYAMASSFAGLPYVLSSALHGVLFPRFAKHYAKGEDRKIAQLYLSAFLASAVFFIVLVIGAWFFSVNALRLIFEPPLAEEIVSFFPILLTGAALQALLSIPFALQLAAGWTSLALRLNLIAAPVVLILVPTTYSVCGPRGVAAVWLIYNIFSFFATLYFLQGRFCYLKAENLDFAKTGLSVATSSIVFFGSVNFLVSAITRDFTIVITITLLGVAWLLLTLVALRRKIARFR